MKQVLVTGGLGFIGSHTVIDLLQTGEYEVIIVDNLSNSNLDTLSVIEKISGKAIKKLYEVDLRDADALSKVFKENSIESIIHFAALKAVGDSMRVPLEYYGNNVCGTINLLELALLHNVNQFIFSSSATVYGHSTQMPLTEDTPIGAINPYGSTKVVIENLCREVCRANPQFNVVLLRYFNPVGAHPSGLIGENPKGEPTNLFPVIARVLLGQKEELMVFGNDYDTIDGTCIRDYIHINDLSLGHLYSLRHLEKKENETNCEVFNLGTGKGSTVLEVVKEMERASNRKIKIKFVDRRSGDAPVCYASGDRARDVLGWTSRYTLTDMCSHLWNYLQKSFVN